MNRQIRGLHEAAYLLASFTFLSQVLALVRDRVFAHSFGAGGVLDAYFAAFRIPDLAFALLTLFISSFALVPLIAARGGAKSNEARELIGSVLFAFGIVALVLSALLYTLIPVLVPALFPGFSAEVAADVILLSRIMLFQPVLLGISSIAASVMQSSQKFVLYALAPIFYNVGIITGAVFLYPAFGVAGLAWGVVLGAAFHLTVQTWPALAHDRALSPRRPHAVFADVRRVVTLSLPRALALSAHHVLLLVFLGAASLSTLGSVAALSFGWNLQSVPLSVIGASYATALFPALAALYTRGERELFIGEVWSAIRHTMFWIMPAIMLMVVLRAHIVRVILGSGAFSWNDTRLTAAILAAFVVSLIAQGALLIFSRAYYAAGRSLEPIAVNVLSAALAGVTAYLGVIWFQNATLTRYFLEDLFRIGGISGTETVMVAIAYSAVMLIAAGIFAVLFARRFGFEQRTLHSLLFSFSASIIGSAAAYGALQLFGPLLPTDTFVGILTQGFVAGVVGLAAWVATLWLLKSRDFREVVTIMHRLVMQRSSANTK